MYRLWLWPLGLAPIFIWAWLSIEYQIPKFTLVIPMVILGIVYSVEERRTGAKEEIEQKIINSVPASKILDLSRGPQIMLGVCAFLMACLIYSQGVWSDPVALFCALVAGACLLPERIRPYFGDIVAVAAVVFCGWALKVLITDSSNTNNPAFPILCGALGAVHLFRRYKHFLPKLAFK